MTNQNKISVLLKQIDLPTDLHHYFTNSELKGVVVYRQKKRWEFYIHIENCLPFDVFYTFLQHVERSFNNIAKIDVYLETENKQHDEKELYLYWRYFLTTIDELVPSHLSRLQTATITNKELMIQVSSEAEAITLRRKISDAYALFAKQYSLTPLNINITVTNNKSEMEHFRQQTKEENEQFIRQMNDVKVANEQTKRKTSKHNSFMFGTSIRDQ